MPRIREVRIKCGHCNTVFRSPIFIGNTDTLEGTAIMNARVNCPKCNQMVQCNKENMSVFYEGGGGEVGPDFPGNKL